MALAPLVAGQDDGADGAFVHHIEQEAVVPEAPAGRMKVGVAEQEHGLVGGGHESIQGALLLLRRRQRVEQAVLEHEALQVVYRDVGAPAGSPPLVVACATLAEMLDTRAVARSLTAAEFTPAQADAITDAVRLAAERGNLVTSDQVHGWPQRGADRDAALDTRLSTQIGNLDARLSTQIAHLRTEQRTANAGSAPV